jgi:cell division septum initiation protein DivIVA
MDILHLVDRLEELFNNSRGLWFTHQVIVDEDRMLDLIDQMRVSIPDEVKKAQQVLAQKDRVLAQAQEEGNRTIQLAREKSDQLVERDVIVQAANARADQIVAKARKEAEAVRREADQYVFDTLSRLYRELDRIMNQVHNGIAMVEKDLMAQPQAQVDEVPRRSLSANEKQSSERQMGEKEAEEVKPMTSEFGE